MINLIKNKTRMKNLKFEKENDGKWYIILPEWEGAHNELEMVAGADTLLEKLSLDGKYCNLNVSEDFVENAIVIIFQKLLCLFLLLLMESKLRYIEWL